MKSLLLLLLLFTLSFNSQAQIVSNYGLKLGLGISNQSWDYQPSGHLDWQTKDGISARLFADFLILPVLQLEGEIGYLRKGVIDKIPITTVDQPDGTGQFFTTNNSLGYLSLSILAKLKFEFTSLTPYIIAGPQLNILLNKNIADGFQIVFDKFKKNNVGFSLGAGAEFKNILPLVFLVEYRFEKDLSNNFNSPNLDIKNYSHVILLGIKI
jgi:opacity protein-like surface antigen